MKVSDRNTVAMRTPGDPLCMKILKWFNEGEVGLSSQTIALCSVGIKSKDGGFGPSHPLDPADLRRCMLLVERIPQVRECFPRLRSYTKELRILVDHWDELTELLKKESGCGEGWRGLGWSAPKCYQRMKALGL